MGPVQFRVAIPAADPLDNACRGAFRPSGRPVSAADVGIFTNSNIFSRYRAEWFDGAGNARRDILAGMVGTFALIPEVIAFSFVAVINPQVGLFASFIIGIVIAFFGEASRDDFRRGGIGGAVRRRAGPKPWPALLSCTEK